MNLCTLVAKSCALLIANFCALLFTDYNLGRGWILPFQCVLYNLAQICGSSSGKTSRSYSSLKKVKCRLLRNNLLTARSMVKPTKHGSGKTHMIIDITDKVEKQITSG
jgi:hypothetical protein